MEWNEGDSTILRTKAAQMQVCEVVKGVDPATHTPIYGGDDREAINGETAVW